MRKAIVAVLLVVLVVPAFALADDGKKSDRDERFKDRVAKFEDRSEKIDAHQAKFTEKCLGANPAAGCAAAAAKIVKNLDRRIAARTANLAKLDQRCAARPADKPCGERAAKIKQMIQERIADLQAFRSAILAKYPGA